MAKVDMVGKRLLMSGCSSIFGVGCSRTDVTRKLLRFFWAWAWAEPFLGVLYREAQIPSSVLVLFVKL
jgi:hypothetical protein